MDTKDSYTNMERAATSPGASGSSVSINVGVPSGTVNLDVLYNMIERKVYATSYGLRSAPSPCTRRVPRSNGAPCTLHLAFVL